MKHFLPAIIFISLMPSCKKDGHDVGEAPSSPEPAETHPWDWIPDDPELVAGRKVYLSECAICHDEGEESAPALTRASEWRERSQKGETVLISHAINGFRGEDGKMPARGGTPSLTDEEVTKSVLYMLATPK
ncbi:c-type cytochrome [Luteolibacter sp. AS25]|uniref:c-type cytochrome n=1 Tax=Luteolibacter sp. AS25 TaxID=3135776 RepID=UPI00398AEB26